MLIYEALRNDHNELKVLFSQLMELSDDDVEQRHRLIELIRDGLIPHARAEESVFYNSLRLMDNTKKIAMHAYKEHLEAESLLRMLQVQDKTHIKWRETAGKLRTAIEHHIYEEESQLFSVAQALFTNEEAIAMAEAFEKQKQEIKDKGFMGTTLEMISNLMPPTVSDNFKNRDSNRHP